MDKKPVEFTIEQTYRISDDFTGIRYLISKEITTASGVKHAYYIITEQEALEFAIGFGQKVLTFPENPENKEGYFKENVYLGFGTVMDLGAHLKRSYLSTLYTVYLKKKETGYHDMSLEFVTAQPDLRSFAIAYHTVTGKDLVKELEANAFQFNKKRVIMNYDEELFETPRQFRWYPKQKLICVTWVFGDSNVDEIYIKNEEEPDAKPVSIRTSRFNLSRHYLNEGWKSVHNIIREEPGVEEIVKGLIRTKVMVPLNKEAAERFNRAWSIR